MQHVDVGLHRLKLSRRGDGPRVEALVHFLGPLADRARLVVDAPLLREHDPVALADRDPLGLLGAQLRRPGFERRALGHRDAAMAELVERGVAVLDEQECLELFEAHVRDPSRWWA